MKKLEEAQQLIEDRFKEFESHNIIKSPEEIKQIENSLNDLYKKLNNFLKSPDNESFNAFKNSLTSLNNDLNPQKKLSSINSKFMGISLLR